MSRNNYYVDKIKLKLKIVVSICKQMIIQSVEQTKEWRMNQPWYANGKQNECELFQHQCIRQITGHDPHTKTNLRLNLQTKEMKRLKSPLLEDDGFEYTEDFDGYLLLQEFMFYFNLKFICHTGGSQNRSLRETYHFIQAQMEHLIQFPNPNIYFVNILDGNGSHRYMSKFHHLVGKQKFQSVRPQVFVGDMFGFQGFWQNFLSQQQKKNAMEKKKSLGQFYTTNYEYILQGLVIPDNINHIIEPFTGAGDLLRFIPDHSRYVCECYDIDPQTPDTIQQDTLLHPPCYTNKFIITNPPYLARNKSPDKTLFDKHKVNDLYKCLIKELTMENNRALGGILIIPINFWCSKRENDLQLRKKFLGIYTITRLNIFEEPVFRDTDYSVCSFQFALKTTQDNTSIPTTIFPEKREMNVLLNETNSYMVGGEIFNLPRTHQYTITRRTRLNTDKPHTNILLKCIDDDNPIQLMVVPDDKIYTDETPNLTARSYATLVIEPSIPEDQQKWLVDRFNRFLEKYREDYNSMFLTAYREYKRKRISFDLAYHIVGHLLETN